MNAQELLERYAAGERDFGALGLSDANLSRANLSHANLSRSSLSVANLSGANLHKINLSHAKLNVARLSEANLTQANLNGAILNVANLIRANLSEAEMVQTSLIRAEMLRADLTKANLNEANLNGVDLREAKLRQADLTGANLSEADLRGSFLMEANLTQANLNGTDLSKTDLSAADLTGAELRHANLHRANLSGASLRGANLRWADLSGADLRWADLSDAKLSGANLIGANLDHANLFNTSLVHADLTQANLMRSHLEGADLSGAILTGAKLHGVSRFSLKTDGMSCEWIDLSPNGDHTQLCHFTPKNLQKFFNQTHPIVQIIVDRPLSHRANLALANTYYQLAQRYRDIIQPPSIEVGYRRTILTFRVEVDELLFPTAYVVALPFSDAEAIQKNALHLVKLSQTKSSDLLGVKESNRLAKLSVAILKRMRHVSTIQLPGRTQPSEFGSKFFRTPTQVILSNSSDGQLGIYHNPMFGKRLLANTQIEQLSSPLSLDSKTMALPTVKVVLDFLQGFQILDEMALPQKVGSA